MLTLIIWSLLAFSILNTVTNAKGNHSTHQYQPITFDACDVCVANQDYCSPGWLPVPNLNLALKGIDIGKKQPMPLKPDGDPSVRGIIFNSVHRNEDYGNMEVNNFLHLTDRLVCTSEFETQAWTNMEQYIHGTSESSMSNWDVGFTGPEITIEAEIPDIGDISMTPPPNSFSYGQGNSDSNSNMENFFSHEQGSISRSTARCSVYDVFIDINEASLSLNPSFIDAIKEIDNAMTVMEKRSTMIKFIETFGTHYAKESVMGIGVEFETRFTEEETLNYDSQTRNECSSSSGGFSLFGYGGHHSEKECTGSLEDTTIGSDTIVKRFTSTTYGTLPVGTQSLEEWSSMVQEMMVSGTLTPLPIKQSLAPIVDILLTPSVAQISHNDGTLINITNVIQTAVYGYLNYLPFFQPSFDWACANTLLLDNKVYKLQEGRINGRNVYKDEDDVDESMGKYLFYSKHGFTVSTSFTSEEEDILTSSPCPQGGAVFEGSLVRPPVPNIQSWQECSNTCSDVSDCNYWQYDNNNKICSLLVDFERIVTSSNYFSIGSSDCPGNSFKYTEGLCAEKNPSRSMWKRNGITEFFEKDLQLESFDSNSVLIVGGVGAQRSSETLFTKQPCDVPNLPFDNFRHTLLLSAGDHKVLSCGGDIDAAHADVCFEKNAEIGQWIFHSNLIQKRDLAIGISMPDGVYIFGGDQSQRTSDFLPKFSNIWEVGPEIPGYGITDGCGIRISNTEIVLIGGYESMNRVLKYNTQTKEWSTMPNLIQGRRNHNCAIINDRIIVTGGWDGVNIPYLSSTEIIPLTTFVPILGGNLNTGRCYFGMLTVGDRFPRLLVLAGETYSDHLDSIEVWNDDKEEWTITPLAFKVPRSTFGYLALPESFICLNK